MYSQIVALHERGQLDKVSNLLLSKLNGLLAADTISDGSQKECTKPIHNLMDALQSCKRLGWVRDKGGHVVADSVAIAQALAQHWSKVTTHVDDCAAFFGKLKMPPNFAVMPRALFRPLSKAPVADALAKMNSGSFLGQNGIPATGYITFHLFSIPLTMNISQLLSR